MKNFAFAAEIKNTLTVAEIARLLEEEMDELSTLESWEAERTSAYETECRVILDLIICYVKGRDGGLQS